MLRYLDRLFHMENSRLPKRIFLWDKELNESGRIFSWSGEIKDILSECNLTGIYFDLAPFATKSTIETITQHFFQLQTAWLKTECQVKPKLRTFVQFKEFGCLPPYVAKPLSFLQRKALAKTRLGCLQVRLETGRYVRPILPAELRFCTLCFNENTLIEDEFHFLFVCQRYATLRQDWFEKLTVPHSFELLPREQQLGIVLNKEENVKYTADFILKAFDARSKVINTGI